MDRTGNDEQSKGVDLYAAALEQTRYEGQLMWQIFGAFLLPHTVFLAFLLQTAFGSGQINSYRPGVFFASIVGGLLCIPWAASYSRNSDYYTFRMAQAREAEPMNWNLLKGQGEQFSAGEKVRIADKTYRVNWLSRVLRTKRSVPLLISFFVIVYLGILVLNGPWWK
jgi:hypothetical protein